MPSDRPNRQRPVVDSGEMVLQAEPDGTTELHGEITLAMVGHLRARRGRRSEPASRNAG